MAKFTSITFTYTGVKELDDWLTSMPLALTHKTLGSANFQAAKPLVDKEKLLAPEGPTGNLVTSIGAIRRPFRSADALGETWVGPRRRKPYMGKHGHLIELGTKKRRTKRGFNRGSGPALPFVRPAFEATKAIVEGLMIGEIRKIINKVNKKLAK